MAIGAGGGGWVFEELRCVSLAPTPLALQVASHQRAIDATPPASIPALYSQEQWRRPVPLAAVLSTEEKAMPAGDGEALPLEALA